MELLVQLIFVIALCKYCLKAALSGSLLMLFGYALFAALFAMVLYPIVIELPMTIIKDMLANKTAVSNIALLTTAEAIAGVVVSVYLLDNYFKPKEKRTKLAFVVKVVPGALVLCSIAYFELIFFKFRVGSDFLMTAMLYSAILLGTVFFVGLFMRYMLQSESIKLEVKIIFNLVILVVGLLVSSSVADYNKSNTQTTIEWGALLALIIGGAALVVLGIWLQKINIKNILKIQKWNK